MFSIIIFMNDFKKDNASIQSKNFAKLAESLKSQKNIELVFIVENNDISSINLIQELDEKNKNISTKIVYNSKNTYFNKVLKNINKMATNDYFFFLTYPFNLNENFFKVVGKVAKSSDIDIIEFRPSLKDYIKWNPKDRLDESKWNKVLKINENKEIIAYSFPFVYNKVYSTDVLSKMLKSIKKLNDSNSSNLLFNDLVYLIFLCSSTYYYIPSKLNELSVREEDVQTFKEYISLLNDIQTIYNENGKYIEEIIYAKWYYVSLILPYFYSDKTNLKMIINNSASLSQKKYFEKLSQIKDKELGHFDVQNKYMLLKKLKEVKLLQEIQPISKWNKTLKELEK